MKTDLISKAVSGKLHACMPETTCKLDQNEFTNNLKPLSDNPTKCSNTLKQFAEELFDYFVKLALKGLTRY